MAREESDREDLLREATALVERVELQLETGEAVVAGFRRDGSLSVFWDGDPVYQFNAARQLRRAYRGGLLFKAEAGRLVSLERRRAAGEVQLVRRELSESETAGMLRDVRDRMSTLGKALGGRLYRIVGQVPADADVIARVANELGRLLANDVDIAPSPRVGGGR